MNVIHTVSVRKVYEFRAQDFGHGVAVADVLGAINWAEQEYRNIIDKNPKHDDWLRVRGDEEGLTFWFELVEREPGS